MSFADAECEALDGKLSLDEANAGGFAEGERRDDGMRSALDGERSGGFEFPRSQRPYRGGDEFRLGKALDIEPQRALDLGLALFVAEVDRRQVHFELRL